MEVTQGLSDEELMLAYQAGDTSAFNELYARYSGRVYSFLGKRVFNKNEHDDLFQGIFLKLHKSRHLYVDQYQFAPWLFTICRTSLLDFLKARRPNLALDDGVANNLASDSLADASLAVSEAVADLSERQRSALEMRYKDGLEFSDIADRLKISTENVRQVISRAVRKLRGKP